ncbi:MAG: penicillin-binding transpeptidase domain-containing protein [Actinomycetota bacterium]|nr:penicillin-binding transpeptidase domain-containing protein [Actinomycetota bacterium]
MNARIVKLFAFITVLFAVLVGFTSYWSVFDANNLKDQRVNKRPLFAAQQIKRGRILTDDGTVIARSVRTGQGASTQFVRRYPLGSLYGHPIGYSFAEQGNSEFEQSHNRQLIGEDSEFSSIFDELRGKEQTGHDVFTNIDGNAQQTAVDLLAGRAGAVVAIEPSTGKVRALVSQPSFDPNKIPTELNEMFQDPTRPLYAAATQGQYPPGSTFKLVTAAAALDSGKISPDTVIDAPASITVQGQPLSNFGGSSFGEINVTTALTNSVNTYFAKLGRRVGEDTMYEYMERFGFNSKPEIDLPNDQLSISGVFDTSTGTMLTPDEGVDVARIAIGQERLLATPIQMAEVAAAIANKGDLMKPVLWREVRDVDGRTIDEVKPEKQSDVISEESAAELTEAMRSVVNEGTGTAAALSGVDVAGKTGTAEVPDQTRCAGLPNQAWFVGFAPADDPQIAVAATVECTDGQGGTVAAPIAAGVMQAVIDG